MAEASILEKLSLQDCTAGEPQVYTSCKAIVQARKVSNSASQGMIWQFPDQLMSTLLQATHLLDGRQRTAESSKWPSEHCSQFSAQKPGHLT